MIDELKVPALITAGTLAMAQFVAPARVWFGQMSDAKPLFGYHRTGYVWTGAVLFAIASFLAVQVIWQLGFSLQAGRSNFMAGLRSWQWFSVLRSSNQCQFHTFCGAAGGCFR